MFKSNRKLNPDMNFFGFEMKTRLRYYDERILLSELDPAKNIYRIPDNVKVVVDIGAHLGGSVVRCAKMGACVFAFEPELYNFELLEYNVKKNGFKDRVRCINKGVGKPGQTKLFVHGKNSGATSAYKHNTGLIDDNFEMVEFISIHDVFDKYAIGHCDLLKLDCEGSEADIIRDFDDNLTSRIAQISVEFHDKKIMKELIDKLSKWYEPENTHRYEWVFKKRI